MPERLAHDLSRSSRNGSHIQSAAGNRWDEPLDRDDLVAGDRSQRFAHLGPVDVAAVRWVAVVLRGVEVEHMIACLA
jgi:hypothetical protein